MAPSSRNPPWVKENQEQQGLVSRSRKYSELILKNTADLCQTILIAGLWIYLISLGVINIAVKRELASLPTPEDQISGLLEHLLKGPCWRFHAFIKALCEDDQAHVVSQVLKLNPQDYEDQEETDGGKQLKKEIKSHQGVYHRTLMKGRLFDIPSLDLPYDMEPCFVEVFASSDGLGRNQQKIPATDILRAKRGKPRPRTVLLSGPPGAGKSSFVRFYVYKWCQVEDGQSDWDLIIILNVSTLNLTPGLSPKEHIREALQQSLQGPGEKNAIMESLDDDELKILVIPDGMDECRSEPTLAMLTELISGCYEEKLNFTILATSRSGLCQVEESLFDRCLKVEGFTREEGVDYVQRFYNTVQKPDDDNIYDYISNSQGELDHILTNPLCTHILCIVTADGTLRLKQGQKLRIKTLFQAVEQSMKRRQLEKNEKKGEKGLTKKNLEEQTICFYNMSLFSLLKGLKILTKGLFSKFKISDQNPYLTFMTKTKVLGYDERQYEQMGISTEDPDFMSKYPKMKEDSHWTYNHEMFQEYLGASALETLPDEMRSTFLSTISSQEKFRNTQKILFSTLGGDADYIGTLSDMILGNLISQSSSEADFSGWPGSQMRNVMTDIKQKSNTNIALEALLNSLMPEKESEMTVDTKTSRTLWQQIRDLGENQAELLQKSGFLFLLERERSLIDHIYDCLHEVAEEHQQLVFDQSLGRTLPSLCLDANGNRNIMYSTGGFRWSCVSESRHAINVHINHSLTDASEAVCQYGQQHLETFMKDNDTGPLEEIRLLIAANGSVWRSSPREQFLATDIWAELLSNISTWSVNANQLSLSFYNNFCEGIQGFLQCLQMESTQEALRRILVQDEGGHLRIKVNSGDIDGEALSSWTNWYLRQDLLQVQMMHITCKNPATTQSQMIEEDDLVDMQHNGCFLFPRPKIGRRCFAVPSSTQEITGQSTDNRSVDQEIRSEYLSPSPEDIDRDSIASSESDEGTSSRHLSRNSSMVCNSIEDEDDTKELQHNRCPLQCLVS